MHSLPTNRRSFALAGLALSVAASLALAACSGGSGASATPVNAALSAVDVSVTGVLLSNGIDQAEIAITLRDASAAPLPGRTIDLAATGAGNLFWPASRVTTDAAGRAIARLSSTAPGAKQVTVLVDPASTPVVLPATPVVQFDAALSNNVRVSVSSGGAEANDFSRAAAISGDGRFVAFLSKAFNLVPGDTNQKEDIFVRDRLANTTERVSLRPSGGQFTDLSDEPALNDDGRYVAFQAKESDDFEIFLRDRAAGVTHNISAATGLNGYFLWPDLSGDARFVAFVRNNGESQHVYVHDRQSGATTLVSKSSSGTPGDGPSYAPSITRNGRWVAFASAASNLVPNDSNDKLDVFVHDRQSGQTRRISVDAFGAEGHDDSIEPAIAADGRWVAFASKAENLVPFDDNGKIDVFRYDLASAMVERISVTSSGAEVDKESQSPDLSADGRFVLYHSLADALAPGDSNGKDDIYLWDANTGRSVRQSLGLGGGDPNEFSVRPAVDDLARVLAFTSKASNLVPSDSNDKEDVFAAPVKLD